MRLILLSFLCLNASLLAQNVLSHDDRILITNKLKTFVSAINNKDYKEVSSLVALEHPNLTRAILDKMNEINSYELSYEIYEDDISEELFESKPVRIEVLGKYGEESPRSRISGFTTYFIFEKKDGSWVIVDTDFAKPYPFWLFSLRLLFNILLIMAMLLFWLWMLIDCAKNHVDNKTMWILSLIILNVAAAIAYYFVIKRRRKKVKLAE